MLSLFNRLCAASVLPVCVLSFGLNAQSPAATGAQAADLQALLMRAPDLPLEKIAVTIQPASADWTLGRVTSAALGRDGMAYVLMRSDRAHPVIVVDRSGRVVRSWGSGM